MDMTQKQIRRLVKPYFTRRHPRPSVAFIGDEILVWAKDSWIHTVCSDDDGYFRFVNIHDSTDVIIIPYP